MAIVLDGTSVITNVDGSAAAPSYKAQDGNTGLSGSADQIVISTGGSERLRIASAGQLGIAGANYGTDGHVLTSTGPSSAPAWEVAAGGGKILQYVYTSDNTLVQESTNTQLLDANITPASASNKILAISHCDCKATPNSLALACLNLYRGDSSGTLIQSSCGGVNDSHLAWTTLHHAVLDSPNTTSSQEYTLTIGRGSSSSSYADTNDNTYYLLLLEVEG